MKYISVNDVANTLLLSITTPTVSNLPNEPVEEPLKRVSVQQHLRMLITHYHFVIPIQIPVEVRTTYVSYGMNITCTITNGYISCTSIPYS